MQTHLPVLSALVVGSLLLASPRPMGAQSNAAGQTAPDNTKTNQRDRSKDEPTADQQKENATDREVSKKIRSTLMQDKSLSTDAHNVKIISQNGEVTLKGVVRSQEEKESIGSKAVAVAGQGHVTNQLEVAPKKNY